MYENCELKMREKKNKTMCTFYITEQQTYRIQTVKRKLCAGNPALKTKHDMHSHCF